MNENPWESLDFNQCEEAVKRLDDYLSRELTTEEKELVVQHLSVCQTCFAMFSFEETLLEHIREKASEQIAPDTLRQKVLGLLQSRNNTKN